MEKTITIPYQPRKTINDILHSSDKRWNVIIAHRRFGKTVAVINHLLRDALTHENARYAFIAPLYKQAKQVAWDYLKYYSDNIPGRKINESELRVDYPNGSRITLYGADNPDSLRGLKLWGVAYDEYSQQPSNIHTEIILPSLADTKGYAIWIGTPQGRNEFVRLYEENIEREDWNCQLWTIEKSFEEDPENYADLYDESQMQRYHMLEDEWLQEWMCNFDAAVKGAYYSKEITEAREEGRISKVPHDSSLEVHTVWDLGISDYTSIGFFQVYGKEIRMIDYYQNHGEGLDHYVTILDAKKHYKYGRHYFPHDIEVRELGTGKSRKEVLEGLGIRVTKTKNLSIEDGINAGRMIFQQLWVDDKKCEQFLDAISQYRQEWDDKKGCFKKTPLHDWTSHAADMYRYFAVSYNQMLNPITKPKQFKVNWGESSYHLNKYSKK